MEADTQILTITTVLFAIALAVTIVVYIVIRHARITRENLQRDLGEDGILRAEWFARFFGQKSKGLAQIRGNGALVLTSDELVFRMLYPRKEMRVPLTQISRVSTPKSFLGKPSLRRLLCVHFDPNAESNAAVQTPEDSEDCMAWEVRDIENWIIAVEAVSVRKDLIVDRR